MAKIKKKTFVTNVFDRGENMLQVVNIKQSPIGTEKAIQYIQNVWNHQNQVSQFYDEICHLSLAGDSLNDFYVLVNDEKSYWMLRIN